MARASRVAPGPALHTLGPTGMIVAGICICMCVCVCAWCLLAVLLCCCDEQVNVRAQWQLLMHDTSALMFWRAMQVDSTSHLHMPVMRMHVPCKRLGRVNQDPYLRPYAAVVSVFCPPGFVLRGRKTLRGGM